VHVKRPDDTKLRDLNAVVKDTIVLLGDAFFLFAQQHNTFSRELELMEHLRVGSLLQTQDRESIRFLVSQILQKVLFFHFIDRKPLFTSDSDSLELIKLGDFSFVNDKA
jgi:hypothetical protein